MTRDRFCEAEPRYPACDTFRHNCAPRHETRFRSTSGCMHRFLIVFLLALLPASQAAILRVAAGASGAGNGSSWVDAFPHLQDALDAAATGDEIWVAAGVYYPDEKTGQADSGANSYFYLKALVPVYGGFAGNETLLTQRDPALHPTILSGDIDQDDVNTDGNRIAETSADIVGTNSITVVRFSRSGASTGTIDGFTITAGASTSTGGGMVIQRPNFTVSNCQFRGNRARSGGAVYNSFGTSSFIHCTFSGNSASVEGGGLYTSAEAKVVSCIFQSNTAGANGGAWAGSGSAVMDCLFLSNSAGTNGGAWYGGANSVLQCRFSGNSAGGEGGAVYNSSTSPTNSFANCLFDSNSSVGRGGALANNNSFGQANLYQCTIAANSSEVGALSSNSSSVMVRNSIIWGNRATATTIPVYASVFPGLGFSRCLIAGSGGSAAWNSAAGSNSGGNLDIDPRFLRLPAAGLLAGAPGDFRLISGSPAINAGTVTNLPADSQDLDGDGDLTEKLPLDLGKQPRVLGAAPDMGVFETGGPGVIAVPAVIKFLPNSGLNAGVLQLAAVFDSSAVGYSLGSVTPSGKATVIVDPVSGALDVTPAAGFAGTLQIMLSATDASGISNFVPLTVEVFPPVLYVDADASGTATGLSWQDAFPTLQAALTLGGSGHQIWVAEGIYYPDLGTGQTQGNANASFQVSPGVSLRGGFAGTETSAGEANPDLHPTILSGDVGRDDLNPDGNHISETPGSITGANSTTLVILSGAPTGRGIDGFILTAAGRLAQSSGGSLRISGGSPFITRCRFSGNTGLNGGAVALTNSANVAFNDCHFGGNTVTGDGGAVWSSGSSVSFRACSFTQNTGSSSSSGGGAFAAMSSSVLLHDCEFLGNQCPATFGSGGAIEIDDSLLTATACLFRENVAYQGGAAHFRKKNPLVIGCAFAANRATSNGGAILNTDSSPALAQCTLAGNTAASQGGAIFNLTLDSASAPKPSLANSIVWNNRRGSPTPRTVSSVEYSSDSHIDTTFLHCVVESSGGSAGWNSGLGVDQGGNLDADPRFLLSPDPAAAPQAIDLRLQAGSPAINTGSLSSLPADVGDVDGDGNTAEVLPLDLAGKPRVAGGSPDPGAYEAETGPALIAAAPRLRFDSLSGLHAAVLDLKTLFAGSAVSFEVEAQSSQQIVSAAVNTATGILDITVLPDAFGTTWIVVRATDGAGRSSYHTVSVDVFPPVVFVKAGATGKANGLTWADAFPTLQAALVVPRIEGITLEIWVAQGVYYPDQGPGQTADSVTSTFRLPANCRLYGGFAGGETQRSARDPQAHPTILSGDLAQDDANGDGNFIAENTDAIVGTNARTIVNADASRAGDVLDGCVITAGDNGAGLSSTGGTLSLQGCSFQGNRGGSGGALRVQDGSATLGTCRFSGNQASSGGAAYIVNSAVTMQDCYFSSNRVIDGGSGGAIGGYGGTSLTLTRCDFESNASEGQGGAISMQSIALSLTDCRFFNSTTTNTSFADGGAVYCDDTPTTILRCTFADNRSGGFGGGALSFVGSLFPLECRDTRFSGNSSGYSGGAVFISSLKPVRFTNCLFTGNSCLVQGGAIYLRTADAIFASCTFTANRSGQSGGAVFEDEPFYTDGTRLIRIRNSILWANEADGSQSTPEASLDTGAIPYDTPLTSFEDCIVANSGGSSAWNPESGVNAGGNRDINPRFLVPVPPTAAPSSAGHFELAHDSPALDTGDNALVTVSTDLAGAPRITHATVDLGAYEGQNDQLDTDGDGLSDAFELSATTPPSPTALTPNGDDDQDGLDNRLEFLFGLDPRHADFVNPQHGAIVEDGGVRYFALSYRCNAWALQFLKVEVERSLTLGLGEAWTTGNTKTISTTPLGGSVDEVTVRSNFPVSSQRAEFLRAQITPR